MSIFDKLSKALGRTSSKIIQGISDIFHNKQNIDLDLIAQIEDLLLSSDIGIQVTTKIISTINIKYASKTLPTVNEIIEQIANNIINILLPCQQPLIMSQQELNVFLICGINGNGKTTTIGKLAAFLKKKNKKILIGACDTFRAAAIEQLELWAKRSDCDIIANFDTKDPSTVAFQATKTALEKKYDVLLIDTAGRLNNQVTLMEELGKIIRIVNKHPLKCSPQILLVLDATTGQNAIQQVEKFREIAKITGLIVTKLDGTAKAGILIYIAEKFNLPIYFVGFGEKIEDLKEFNAKEFVHSY